MPFTPSHAAAALLFVRTPLVPAAIVAGSVAPDLPYYLPLPVDRELTHEPLGVVTIDLGLALLAFLAWRLVLRAPVLDLSPAWLRERMPQRTPRSGQHPAVVVVIVLLSLVVGAITHLAWDEFTHPGFLVDRVPMLQVQLGPLVLHKWLQHASSIIGLAALAWYAARWVRRTPPLGTPAVASRLLRLAAWITVAVVFVVAGLTGWTIALLARHSEGLPFAILDPGIVFLTARICVGAALGTAVLVCLGWYLYRRAVRPA